MENSKTLKEATEEITSLVREVNWSKDKEQAIAYFVFDEDGVTGNIIGHCNLAASAIATLMACNKDVRDVILGAYEAYVNYMAKKLSPIAEPIVKYVEQASKSMLESSTSVKASQEHQICLMSAKFDKHKS